MVTQLLPDFHVSVTDLTFAVPSCSPPIRGYLLDGKFFVGAALASTLTKLVFRYIQLVPEEQTRNVSTSHVYSSFTLGSMGGGILEYLCRCHGVTYVHYMYYGTNERCIQMYPLFSPEIFAFCVLTPPLLPQSTPPPTP